jgi:GNAT superfamily N-acetyltransferase
VLPRLAGFARAACPAGRAGDPGLSGTAFIRPAEPADIPALAEIRAAEWETAAYWQARIGAYLAGTSHPREALPDRTVLVAEEGDRIVGFVAGHRTRRFGCDGEVEWINVRHEARRGRIASRLLGRLAQWFSAHGVKRVCVDVAPDDAPARAFYVRNGAADLRPSWLVWADITRLAEPSP